VRDGVRVRDGLHELAVHLAQLLSVQELHVDTRSVFAACATPACALDESMIAYGHRTVVRCCVEASGEHDRDRET
ncbi:MAG: hypothetical protein M0010_22145, partial [Actinomycetota bacterium]|nr:hypothetical protein [Actinomycetota bacterium]